MVYNKFQTNKKRMYNQDQDQEKKLSSKSKNQCVYCANCGGIGHIYKNCNLPITSFGIICIKLVTDKINQSVFPVYLMVQRKDSLNKVEFVRGKYELKQKNYIMNMFKNMTDDERNEIKNNDFDEIWKTLWKIDHINANDKEFNDSKRKFEILHKGYIIDRGAEDGGFMDFSLNYVLENTKSQINESEWGFPKGRRNINESDVNCAIREFNEETSMKMKYIKIYPNICFEETFSGSNKIRYRHVYYLACCPSNLSDQQIFTADIKNKITDIDEIKNIKWFRYNDGQRLIREQNKDRKELFRKVNQLVLKNITNIYTKTKFLPYGFL